MLVIHPVDSAIAASAKGVSFVEGALTRHPKITTGAGDHFNAGFCLGQLLGLDAEICPFAGRHHQRPLRPHRESPGVDELLAMWQAWPEAGKS